MSAPTTYTEIMPQKQQQASTPPPHGSQSSETMVEAQPAYAPTWHGFLDTTEDAMMVLEAALQGRLKLIKYKPNSQEHTAILTSGTVLVYENVLGMDRWRDAAHWSTGRKKKGYYIYRQLNHARKRRKMKSAQNSRQTKRKGKERSGPARSKTGEIYANFAQTLTSHQQQRFCGPLVAQYDFKKGGLVKKTISVKYKGTSYCVISYYSLEDVVDNKLKQPSEDLALADIQPRSELLTSWKVSLEDKKSKDMPLEAGYARHMQPSHVQDDVPGKVTRALGAQEVMRTHASSHYLFNNHQPHCRLPTGFCNLLNPHTI